MFAQHAVDVLDTIAFTVKRLGGGNMLTQQDVGLLKKDLVVPTDRDWDPKVATGDVKLPKVYTAIEFVKLFPNTTNKLLRLS